MKFVVDFVKVKKGYRLSVSFVYIEWTQFFLIPKFYKNDYIW